jgi:hypothetical protein
MAMQEKFILDTDAERFVTWLRRFPSFPFGNLRFPVGEGRQLHPSSSNPPHVKSAPKLIASIENEGDAYLHREEVE